MQATQDSISLSTKCHTLLAYPFKEIQVQEVSLENSGYDIYKRDHGKPFMTYDTFLMYLWLSLYGYTSMF